MLLHIKNIILFTLDKFRCLCSGENELTKLYSQRLISNTYNQGLAYNKNRLFSANDIDGVNNRIIVYDYSTMRIIKDNTT
jgi:hypothetical protein